MSTQDDTLASKIRKNLSVKTTEISFFPILKNSFTPLQDKASVRFFRYCQTFFCFCYLWGMLGSSMQQAPHILQLIAEILRLSCAEGSGTHVASSEHLRIHSSIHHWQSCLKQPFPHRHPWQKKAGGEGKSTVQLRLFQSVLQFLFSSYLHTDNSSKVKKGFAPLGPLCPCHFNTWAYSMYWKIKQQ